MDETTKTRNIFPCSITKLCLVLLPCLMLSGCARLYDSPGTWGFKPKLKSAIESDPYGTLVLKRGTPNCFVLVDGCLGFGTDSDKEASFRLAPGTHDLKIRYYERHTYPGTTAGYIIESDVLKRSVDIQQDKIAVVDVSHNATAIQCRVTYDDGRKKPE